LELGHDLQEEGEDEEAADGDSAAERDGVFEDVALVMVMSGSENRVRLTTGKLWVAITAASAGLIERSSKTIDFTHLSMWLGQMGSAHDVAEDIGKGHSSSHGIRDIS